MDSNRGGITVFLAVIFMALLVFTGTFVDIARISVADRKVESAMATAARSVLAGYDEALAGEFGIFGLENEAALESEFRKYFRLNLLERHEGIKFIKYEIQPEKTVVETYGSLLDEAVFKQELLEYMKYKAPILMSESVIEQFKKAKLRQKAEFADKEKQVRDDALRLQSKVGELNRQIGGIKGKITDLTEQTLADLDKNLLDIINVYIPDSLATNDDYEGARQKSEDYLDERDQSDNLTNRESGIIGNSSTQFESVSGDCEQVKAAAEVYRKKVAEAKASIAPIRSDIDGLDSQINDIQRSISKLKKHGPQPIDSIADLEEQLEELEDQKNELEHRITDIIDDLKVELDNSSLGEIEAPEDEVELPTHGEDKSGILGDKIDELRQALGRLAVHIGQEQLIAPEEFEKTAVNGRKYFEEAEKSLEIKSDEYKADYEKSYSEISGFIKRISSLVEGNILDLRDKLYITEYVMDKFTFLTSQTERSHLFRKGEVEYILNGADIPYEQYRNHQSAVIVNVAAEMWFLRFAIDAIDSFAVNKIPNPLARLGWALVEGAVDASTEMLLLLKGDGVNICPSCKSGPLLRYSDHLRLMLLMQDEDETLRRIQQLVQVDVRNLDEAGSSGKRTDFRLGNFSTAFKAEAEVKVNLYFLPMLRLDKLGFKNFEADCYVIRREVYVGY